VAQRLDDRAPPSARAPEPSVSYGDRPTPIVDVSREVAAASAASDMRSTSRLRPSQIHNLLQLTKDEAAAKQASIAPPTPGPAAPSPPTASQIETSPLTTAALAAQQPRSVAIPVALGLSALSIALVIGYAKTRPARPARPPIAPMVAPATEATAIAPPARPSLTAPGVTTAEVHARETLNRLRTGLDACIRNGIHALPGGSPAVPPDLDALKDGPFTPAPGDWKTAVWSCAQFQTTEPMDFQLQWQLVKPNSEGMGIAWVDRDHDGVADRAFGFSIKLGPKNVPMLGEVREIPADTPVSTLKR
jgi:hypothetical protein